MAIKSGFFNSVNGDRKYNALDMSEYFDGLITNGVYESIGGALQVIADGTAMVISVRTGRAIIDCHWLKNDSVYNITLSPSDVQFNRCDLIGVKLDYNARTMSIVSVEGTPSLQASVPYINDTETVKYLWLGYAYILAGATTIKQGNIFDLRGSSYCPYVTGLIKQVDTSQLFAQWQDACESFYNNMTAEMTAYFEQQRASFDDWYNTLTSTLTVDTYIQKYQRSIVTANDTNILAVLIDEYNRTKDILFININGIALVENVDYTIGGTDDNPVINFTNLIEKDNRVTFVALKSKIGSST